MKSGQSLEDRVDEIISMSVDPVEKIKLYRQAFEAHAFSDHDPYGTVPDHPLGKSRTPSINAMLNRLSRAIGQMTRHISVTQKTTSHVTLTDS